MTTNQALAAELREIARCFEMAAPLKYASLERAAQALSRPEFTESDARKLLSAELIRHDMPSCASLMASGKELFEPVMQSCIAAVMRAVKERESSSP